MIDQMFEKELVISYIPNLSTILNKINHMNTRIHISYIKKTTSFILLRIYFLKFRESITQLINQIKI